MFAQKRLSNEADDECSEPIDSRRESESLCGADLGIVQPDYWTRSELKDRHEQANDDKLSNTVNTSFGLSISLDREETH